MIKYENFNLREGLNINLHSGWEHGQLQLQNVLSWLCSDGDQNHLGCLFKMQSLIHNY